MYNIKILIESKTIARLCVRTCLRIDIAKTPTFVFTILRYSSSLIQSSSDFLILSEQD